MLLRSALLEQAALFVGWVYGTPSYPSALPGVKLPMSPPGPRYTNCCAFVESVVVGGAVRAGLAVEWGLELHNRAMVLSIKDRMSPVEALCDAGLAWTVRTEDRPPPWTVCQGWRGSRGHTFIVADTAGNDLVLLLEANKGHGLNGPGWRSIGSLDGAELPQDWSTHPRAWTWAAVREAYPDLAACHLRVDQ